MKKKVLIIGLDGCRPDCVNVCKTPNIDKLAKNGVYSWDAKTEIQTVSGPAWTALLCGVHSDKSNLFGNDFSPRNMEYKSIFYLAKKWDSHIKCVGHSNWKPIITKIAEKKTLDSKSSGSDKKMTKNLVKDINKGAGDIYFIQLDEIDGAGHTHTYSPDSKKYLKVIEQSDVYVGEILNAVESRPIDEEWLICLVSDHGGSGKGHGKPTMFELTICFIISGKPIIEKGEIKFEEDEYPEIVDVVPTIAKFLGMPVKDHWDGVVRGL